MKRIILFFFLVLSCFIGKSQQLFFEDFNSVADNATTGTAAGTAPAGQRAWSINTGAGAPAAGSFSKKTYGSLERFTANQTGANEGIWRSGIITIAAGKQVALDISLVTYNASASDYVKAYYILNNNGVEVLFGSAIGGNYIISEGASVVLTGTSVQVVVRAKENTTGDDGNGNPNMMRFDDVEVTQVTTLYSRNGGGNWGTSGTWSTVALNGTNCACTPDNTTNVVVGNNDVVNITGSSDVVHVTVQDASTLRWTANNVSLNLTRGGSMTVSNTASVFQNGNAGAQIIFPAAAVVSLTVNSSNANALSIGDLVVSAAATMTISGTGDITTIDDFTVSAAANITNNLTGTFTITDDLNFTSTNATFTNTRTITATATTDLTVGAAGNDGNTFTNSSTGVLNVVTINTNSADFTVNNSGTINQTSNFTNVVAGGSFNNLNGSTWNFGGTHLGTAMRLFCNNGVNTFNYNRAAGANLITPQDAYSNLIISGAGVKAMGASFNVNQNLSIQGTASLNSATFSLTVAGTTAITGGTGASFNDVDATGAGINTFIGNVSVATGTSFISTNTTTSANLVFRGGIANAGTFTGGGATFNTNAQSISGTGLVSFANLVIVTGIAVTNDNSNAVTMSNTAAAVLSGTGTWTQGNGSTLNYAGSTATVTTFNASTAVNTVNYNAAGNQTIRNPSSASTYYNLSASGTGTKSSSANHIVNNTLSISGTAIMDPLTFDLTVNGITTITGGSFNDSNITGIDTFVGNVGVSFGASFISTTVATTANLVFRGGIANAGTFTAGGATFDTNAQPLTGAGAMSFANNVAINNIGITNSNTGAFTITGSTTLTSGDYTDNNNVGVSTFVGVVTLAGATSDFNTTAVSATANLIFRGGITNNGATFTAGGATFDTNGQSIAGTSGISFANLVAVTGVVVTNNNPVFVTMSNTAAAVLSGTGTWTQGNNSTLNYAGNTLTVTVFNASNTGNTVNYNATGNQTIRNPTGSTYYDLATSGSGTKTSSANHTASNDLFISGTAIMDPLTFDFVITGTTAITGGSFNDSNNTGIDRFVGNVSVSLGASFNSTTVTTTANVVFKGGIANAGTFTGGGATFDTNSQALTGNGAMSFANVIDVNSITLTNSNTSTVSITSMGLSLIGTGTWSQGVNSTLNFGGSAITVTNFNTAGAGNTVNYNSAPTASPVTTGNAQAIRVPASGTYVNLRFNNTFATPPQLTLATTSPITVSGVLTMTSGRVSLGSNITLSSSAAGALVHGLTAASGWMYGAGSIVRAIPVSAITIGNADGFFPTGSAADFRPFFIGKGAAGSGNITLLHTENATTAQVSIADTGPAATIFLRDNAVWNVSSTLAAGTFVVRYGGTGLGGVTNLAHLRSCLIASVITASTHVGASGSFTDPRVERSAITSARLANNYYVGSTAYASPLPISLLYFKANLEQDEVSLNWATAQETNNDFFTIEKSSNPEHGFQQLLKVAGQGNSNVKQEYYATDRNPYTGLSYYRLKQTDFNGTFTYSDLVSVNYEGSTLAFLKVYPNPLKDNQTVKVVISGLKGVSEVPLVIYNFLGQKILEKTISVNHGGIVQEEFFFEKPLTPGVFIVKAGPTLQLTQRLVVE